MVGALFGRLTLRSEVLEHLGTDPTLSEPVRRKALDLARSTSDEDEAKRVVERFSGRRCSGRRCWSIFGPIQD